MSAADQRRGAAYDLDAFRRDFAVSRETADRLACFVALLIERQRVTNLVSRASLEHVWHRHVADSAQLLAHIPDSATRIADLGSGGGFPGLVLAICLAERPGMRVELIESNAKKCTFLNDVIAATGAPANVVRQRIEDIGDRAESDYHVITARALAPLDRLLSLSAGLRGPDTVSLFLKGQDVDNELTEATKYWKLVVETVPSLTSPQGTVLIIKEAARVRS